MEENLHFWILPKGTVIQYQGIPYYLKENTEVLGNTPVPKEFKYPSDEEMKEFLGDD